MTKVADIDIEMGSQASESDVSTKNHSVTVQFSGVHFTVDERSRLCGKKTSRPILRNLKGEFQPGRLQAIMGSSGAGKTTLLNVLAGRLRGKRVTGQVLFNGRPLNTLMKRKLAYVTQDDILLENLTPRENLRYAARLQLKGMSRKNKYARVEDIIKELNLTKCANTVVGTPGLKRGLSGGERKRLNIALSLLRNPMVTYLDEPTSGLDSTTSFQLIQTLKTLAKDGRNIVMTIHQPSAAIFEVIDDFYLLADGDTVYSGPGGKDILSYLERIRFPCSQYTNPADHVIDLMQNQGTFPVSLDAPVGYDSEKAENEDAECTPSTVTLAADGKHPYFSSRASRVKYLHKCFKESEFFGKYPDDLKKSKGEDERFDQLEKPNPFKTMVCDAFNWLPTLSVLASRDYRGFFREKLVIRQRIVMTIALALLNGLLYFQIGNNQASIRDRQGVLFFIALNQFMQNLFGVLFVFPKQRAVYLRERAEGLYTPSAYFASKTLVDLPLVVIFPTIFVVVIYFMVGLQLDAEKFFITWATVIATANTGSALGYIISAGVSNPTVALAVAPAFMVPVMLFAGLFIATESIPVYLRWIGYLSPVKYALEVLFKNELSGLSFHCSSNELVSTSSGSVCPVTTGDGALTFYGYEDVTMWKSALALVCLGVGMRLVGLLALKMAERIARKKGAI